MELLQYILGWSKKLKIPHPNPLLKEREFPFAFRRRGQGLR